MHPPYALLPLGNDVSAAGQDIARYGRDAGAGVRECRARALAAGSSWPAHDERAPAQLIVGSPTMPAQEASAVVALGDRRGGALRCWRRGHGAAAVFARRAVGVGLLTRGLAGGVVAADVLGLPEPGSRFRELDNTVYRPLCLALGAATFASARR